MPETTASWIKFTIAFYNVENLFDTINDPKTHDDDFTKEGRLRWDKNKFDKKIRNLGAIIKKIGSEQTNQPPIIIGLAEIENASVLEALISSKSLKQYNYGFVHFDSKDERGIDTALLYRKEFLKIESKKAHPVEFIEEDGEKDFTRDILQVSGEIAGQRVNILVNHWPSRRAGAELTEPSRLKVSKINKQIISEIRSKNNDAKIIIMGDFNDDPFSKSIQELVSENLYNPMELLHTRDHGSLTHKGNWNLFDQILVSQNFIQQYGNAFRFDTAEIFNLKSVQVFEGPYKGHPFRTYAGPKYLGGISDHFPVFLTFTIKPLNVDN
ncbi:endonuclease [Patiriisocius marinus]|uniref:Endonuclease n=1 Tax=Patiriisocius marinus TaxID=1397112 RepID=A0A5J4IVF3_9FLAO|nr:endonuclease/exonuclease/phosphatase family protein [Patiriisocius marinus]GER58834.1 endonuclease [Patiriisocius marinus]